MSSPNDEKQKEAIIVPTIICTPIISIPSKMTLTTKIREVIQKPNKKEAVISPRIMAHTVIGAETNLSNVLILVSHGAITGPIEATVTKSGMPHRPGIKNLRGNFFPKIKAVNKKDGMSKPDIMTGPFK